MISSLGMYMIMVQVVAIIWGNGNMKGPLAGAILLLLIPEALRILNIPDNIAAEVRIMLYGFLLIMMVHIKPKGLFGIYKVD